MTKYRGSLAQPIASKRLPLLADEGAEAQRIADARIRKLPALYEFHGVPLGDADALVLSMAVALVPGFKISAPAGRKRGLDELDKAHLRRDVEAAMKATGKQMGPAIKQVMATKAWRDKLARKSIPSIKQDLKEGARWLRIVEDAEAYRRLVQLGQAPK